MNFYFSEGTQGFLTFLWGKFTLKKNARFSHVTKFNAFTNSKAREIFSHDQKDNFFLSRGTQEILTFPSLMVLFIQGYVRYSCILAQKIFAYPRAREIFLHTHSRYFYCSKGMQDSKEPQTIYQLKKILLSILLISLFS